MGRNPEKTEQIRIYCRPALKARWAGHATFFDDNPSALEALLDTKQEWETFQDEHPELTGGYFS